MRRIAFASLALASLTSFAAAQGDAPVEGAPADGTPAEAPIDAAMPPAPPAPGPALRSFDDGTGFRNGFSLSAGQEFGTTDSGVEISGQLFGVDWRIGAQVTKAIAVYLDTHLSLGTVKGGASEGTTGNFATALVGEYTLPMRLFIGGGFGYGVLNNPSGPLAQVRIGYYPFEKTSQGKARRLNVALDTRLYFIDEGGDGLTMKHIALSIGYDRF